MRAMASGEGERDGDWVRDKGEGERARANVRVSGEGDW